MSSSPRRLEVGRRVSVTSFEVLFPTFMTMKEGNKTADFIIRAMVAATAPSVNFDM